MTTPELLIFLLIVIVSVVGLLVPCIMAWKGSWRTWAVQGPGPMIFTKRNYAPLHFGVGAFAIAAAAIAIYASVERLDSTDLIWDVVLIVFIPVGLVMPWWWPAVLTPRWHKEWVRRGGLPETPLWGPDEQVPEAAARKGWH